MEVITNLGVTQSVSYQGGRPLTYTVFSNEQGVFGDVRNLHGRSTGMSFLITATKDEVERYWNIHKTDSGEWIAETDTDIDKVGQSDLYISSFDWLVMVYRKYHPMMHFAKLKEDFAWPEDDDQDSLDAVYKWHSYNVFDGSIDDPMPILKNDGKERFYIMLKQREYFQISILEKTFDNLKNHPSRIPFAEFTSECTMPDISISNIGTVVFIDDGVLRREPIPSLKWGGRDDLAPFRLNALPPSDIRFTTSVGAAISIDGKAIFHISSVEDSDYSLFLTLFGEYGHYHIETKMVEISGFLGGGTLSAVSLNSAKIHVAPTPEGGYFVGLVLLQEIETSRRPIVVSLEYKREEGAVVFQEALPLLRSGDQLGELLVGDFNSDDIFINSNSNGLIVGVIINSPAGGRSVILIDFTM